MYLLYASGEIALVMIGILLALEVDNWNNKRQQDKAGAELSSRLYQELVAVKEYSEIILSEYINQIDYTDLILTRGQQLDIDSLIESD